MVFTVSHTAVATVAAIERTGATAALIDVEPGTYTIAPHELSRALRIIREDAELRQRPLEFSNTGIPKDDVLREFDKAIEILFATNAD